MPPSNGVATDTAPRTGMLATVRNRRGLIRSVEPFDSSIEGRTHLVSIEYLDTDGAGDDTLIWEREPSTRLLDAEEQWIYNVAPSVAQADVPLSACQRSGAVV